MTSPEQPVIQLSAYEDLAEMARRLDRSVGSDAADKTIDKILEGIDLLGTMPYLGPVHHDPMLARLGYRKLILGKYVVVYRVDGDCAIVLRVFYGSSNYTRRIAE